MTRPIHPDLRQSDTGSARPLADTQPVVGVIYNPRSHRNQGRDLEIATQPNVHLALPRGREAIVAALEGFARKGIDFLVINGGDGTVRDVLTAGQTVFGERWPALAVLPKGKTNALNVDLGAPAGWNLTDAMEAFPRGHRVHRRPVRIVPLGGAGEPMLGFILGAGAFTTGIRAGQDAHRMGAFNSLAVGVTAAWGVLQALFGTDRNQWRRGAEMELLLGPERMPLPHSGRGYEGRRSLMLASTLERFPLGLQVFGPHRHGLKLGAMDRPRRRLLAAMPAIVAGWQSGWLERSGLHLRTVDSFEFAIADQFILDGEAFAPGRYRVEPGPELAFVVP
jgi:diacylglycerol kinase (ATP)